jgi:phosphatidylglycerol:prolipoprotein diacylglycerol transferase
MRPVLFEIGGWQVPSYGVMVWLAIIMGILLALKGFEDAGIDTQKALWTLMVAVVAGVLVSRAWWMVEAITRDSALTLADGPRLAFSRAGLTWYGALVGGLVGFIAAVRAMRLPLGGSLDAFALALPLGQAIGRVGCFLAGEDYGRTTDSWVGIAFPNGVQPTVVPVHPTQLYEIVWLAGVTAWLWSRRGKSPSLIAEYLALAGLGRFAIELFRTNPAFLGPLTNAQVVAIASVVVGASAWIARARIRAKSQPSLA